MRNLRTYENFLDHMDKEELALREYIQDGGTVLFLANPYIYESDLRDYSSNVLYLNAMMSEPTSDAGDSLYGSLNFETGKKILMNDFVYKYDDERFLYLDNISFVNDNPIISGEKEEDKVNEILTMSTMITTISGQKIINTTYNSYTLEYTDDDENGAIVGGSVRNHTILAADVKYTSRAISCGSAIMFSDLEIPGANMTWFEAYDNAKLWKNMIEWLFFRIPVYIPPPQIGDFWIFALSILGGFLLLIVFGLIFFTAGKEAKKVEVSETIQRMRKRDERKKKDEKDIEKDIEKAFYAEDVEEPVVEEAPEEKEVDMKSISDELKKKPPKTRSRSERRRRN